MKGVAKFSHEYVDQFGLKRWVGLELEFDTDRGISDGSMKASLEALAEVEKLVKQAAGTSSQAILNNSLSVLGLSDPLPEIQIKEEAREIGLKIEHILSCEDLITLRTYKLLVRSDDKLKEAYQNKEKELMDKQVSNG